MTTYKITTKEQLDNMPKVIINPPKPTPDYLEIDPVEDAEIEAFFADFKL